MKSPTVLTIIAVFDAMNHNMAEAAVAMTAERNSIFI
jgi:hypothetical protein